MEHQRITDDALHSGLLSRIPCGVMVIDESGTVIYANDFLSDLTAKGHSELVGNRVESIGLEEMTERSSDTMPWERNDDLVVQIRTTLVTENTQRKPVLVTARGYDDSSGKRLAYVCIQGMPRPENRVGDEETAEGSRDHFYGLVGRTPQMQNLYNLIEMASDTGVNVVIMGESGTGKELVASGIHRASPRHDRPFVRVNCAAIAENLLESELFGHVKGAFTGAYRDRVGTFEAAHEGTILLDEIAEISPAMQAKLLRVLQERVIVRVGDNQELPVDVRIIAATNKNLRALVKKGTFREDLFYRLNVFPVHLPSLNERKPDIPLLCSHFLKKYRDETGKNIRSISSDAMRILLNYCWPGNVRELENTIEHAFVLCRGEEIQVVDFPHELRVNAVREGICAEKIAGVHPTPTRIPHQVLQPGRRLNISKDQLAAILKEHGNNKAATARYLGISTVGLWKKMKKMGLQ